MSAVRETRDPRRRVIGAAAIVVVVAVVVAVIAWWPKAPVPVKTVELIPSSAEMKSTERSVPSIASAVPSVQADRRPAIDPTWRQAFSTSRNYREFIAAAKQDVAHGGGAYALYAMETCDWIHTNLREVAARPRPAAEDSRDIMARVDARALLESRCATVQGPEFDLLHYSRELRSKAGGGDPLDDIYQSVFTIKDRPAGRRRLIEAILEAQDPLLVARFGGLVETNWSQKTAYFDGAVYRIDQEPALLAAAQLLVCGIGFDCTAANDTDVAIVCVVITLCEHDRFAIAKRQADAQGYSFDRVMDFHGRMVEAFRQKRVDAFVRPS